MQRLIPALFLAILVSGCGTTPVSSETLREVVLQYLGGDVGTAGPFFKGGKKELDGLSASDRAQAEKLIDQGAAVFLVFAGKTSASENTGSTSRIVLVQDSKIVGDFRAAPKPATP
jgi:hypothetical protein